MAARFICFTCYHSMGLMRSSICTCLRKSSLWHRQLARRLWNRVLVSCKKKFWREIQICLLWNVLTNCFYIQAWVCTLPETTFYPHPPISIGLFRISGLANWFLRWPTAKTVLPWLALKSILTVWFLELELQTRWSKFGIWKNNKMYTTLMGIGKAIF